jgi:DUF971 family protein
MSEAVPLNIQLIGNELALAWSDGAESYITLEVLRRACPCAACAGEPDATGRVFKPQALPLTPRSFELRGHRLIGGYALQPIWNDGHESGLFSWKLLRALGTAAGA